MIGRTLGNYRVIEQIGMGGMATVYKAYDPDTDRYVAIKVLPEHFSKDPKFRQRFQREAKAIAKLEHIHILPLFAYGEEESTAYMVMRYLEAGSLTDRIRAGALPLPEASRLLSQIASALDHAHSHGVLHRDVKPSNVLLDDHGNAFLTDFGIAKMVESTLDLTGANILGTPAYMSPEQCRGGKELTPASDQYSLGIILYEMVTGRTPFQAETPIALIHMQLNEPLPLPRQVLPSLPEEAERVMLKALTKDPALRFPTCGEMAASFARVVAETGLTTPPADDRTIASGLPTAVTSPGVDEATALHDTAEQLAIKPPFRRRVPAWVLGLMAILVVGLIGVAIVIGMQLSGEEEGTPVTGVEAEGVEIAEPEGTPVTEVETEGVEIAEPEGVVQTRPGDLPSNREVRPCDWDGLGPGLCIYAPPREKPIQKILEDANLEFLGGASWSPDGEQIAFSALEPGGSPHTDLTIYVVNADGTNLSELPQLSNDIEPAWSPDGQWLAFHSGCDLGMMHPDGSEPIIFWHREQGRCTEPPQWSPDSQSVVASVLAEEGGAELTFPLDREVWVISTDGGTSMPVATITYQNDHCRTSEVAFSPDGRQVAYIDADCQPQLVAADGSGHGEPLDDFPYSWMARTYPQWEAPFEGEPSPEQESFPEVEAFFEDFEEKTLDPSRWELRSDLDEADLLQDGQFRIEFENDLSRPWDMDLVARVEIPALRYIEFNMGLEEGAGRHVGFGLGLMTENEEPKNILFNADGAVLFEEKGEVIELTRPTPLPVEHNFVVDWQDVDVMVISIDGEPVHKLIVPGFATGVMFWAHLEPGETMTGFLDDVYLEYATEEGVEAPPQPGPEEQFEVKFFEPCDEPGSPQICVRYFPSDEVVHLTEDLDFGAIFRRAWSPDGEQIVFDAGSDPETSSAYDHKLYVINADGSELRQITTGDSNDISPAWSPDGDWIAFNRDCGEWVVHPDGSGVQMLMEETGQFCLGLMAWSPDSEQIAFVKLLNDNPGTGEIWLVHRDGADPHAVHPFDLPTEPWEAAWSPDGQQIALWHGQEQPNVLLVNVDGSPDPEVLDQQMIDDKELWSWLPDFWPQWVR